MCVSQYTNCNSTRLLRLCHCLLDSPISPIRPVISTRSPQFLLQVGRRSVQTRPSLAPSPLHQKHTRFAVRKHYQPMRTTSLSYLTRIAYPPPAFSRHQALPISYLFLHLPLIDKPQSTLPDSKHTFLTNRSPCHGTAPSWTRGFLSTPRAAPRLASTPRGGLLVEVAASTGNHLRNKL